MRKRVTPEEFALRLNTLRNEFNSELTFSQSEMTELLKENGIPSSISYFGIYVKFGIIVRSERGVYQFIPEPVYKGVIEQALTSIRKSKMDSYNKNSGKQEREDLSRRIQSSIEFLKSHGFLVYKPM